MDPIESSYKFIANNYKFPGIINNMYAQLARAGPISALSTVTEIPRKQFSFYELYKNNLLEVNFHQEPEYTLLFGSPTTIQNNNCNYYVMSVPEFTEQYDNRFLLEDVLFDFDLNFNFKRSGSSVYIGPDAYDIPILYLGLTANSINQCLQFTTDSSELKNTQIEQLTGGGYYKYRTHDKVETYFDTYLFNNFINQFYFTDNDEYTFYNNDKSIYSGTSDLSSGIHKYTIFIKNGYYYTYVYNLGRTKYSKIQIPDQFDMSYYYYFTFCCGIDKRTGATDDTSNLLSGANPQITMQFQKRADTYYKEILDHFETM